MPEPPNFVIVGTSPLGAIWAPEDRASGAEIAEIIDRAYRERTRRRVRERRTFGELDRAAEWYVAAVTAGTGSMMRSDEVASAAERRGLEVACRPVVTITREQAEGAGL